MERFDYRNSKDYLEEASIKLDAFTARQAHRLTELIDTAKVSADAESKEYWMKWFDSSILPVIKDFAEMTCSLLEVEKDSKYGIITIMLKNAHSIDITESCMIRTAIFASAHILIEPCDEGVSLQLTFDCNKFI